MLADRIRMCSFRLSKKDDPLGSPGNQDLILGDMSAGYFGTVNNLVTNTQLTNLMGMTAGTLLDAENTDVTFHKFAHKGRILFIPSRPIKHTISWDNIQSQNGVKGKVISIDANMYLCRLMTGSRHYYTSNNSMANGGEWYDTFFKFHTTNGGALTDSDIYVDGNGSYTLCQEVHSSGIANRVFRQGRTYMSGVASTSGGSLAGWRPVLEVL
ncbi:hypothetical protein CIW83_18485 [Tissierella sp. P1]|uniref:hypothetical protein n=1 Tax=Tissierella sp. P1 TaxID=1280483 RepID=UPI000BA17B4F|nr:hypothetical protein [Tissierella sp. P1]OZV10806.1 hypothetical protein CIW83_18485 [Tissierella sp. P1]